MAADLLATLQQAKENILLAIKTATENPKPNYSIDGQSVSWSTYLTSLVAQAKAIDEQISAIEPFEIVSQGCTGQRRCFNP